VALEVTEYQPEDDQDGRAAGQLVGLIARAVERHLRAVAAAAEPSGG
jgi:hypothetical protein